MFITIWLVRESKRPVERGAVTGGLAGLVQYDRTSTLRSLGLCTYLAVHIYFLLVSASYIFTNWNKVSLIKSYLIFWNKLVLWITICQYFSDAVIFQIMTKITFSIFYFQYWVAHWIRYFVRIFIQFPEASIDLTISKCFIKVS